MTYGTNSHGALGISNQNFAKQFLTPTVVPIEKSPHFIQISGASQHFAAVAENGDLFTWGRNDRGQCGHKLYNYDITTPRKVEGIDPIRFVCCTTNFTAAVSCK
jgi:alpha-tubulin suppressor-like RCC1 family protein